MEFWLRELGTTWSFIAPRARVVDLIDETADTRTLVLDPGRRWPGHRAGQYVPIEIEVDGARVRRCYSISSGSTAPGARRIGITVRRVPGGRASTALHQLCRGAVVGLGTPAGDFVLDAPVASSRATFATVFPDSRTRRTASALNSGVNRRRVRFVTLGLMDTSIMTGEGWEVSTKAGQAYLSPASIASTSMSALSSQSLATSATSLSQNVS